MNKIGGIYSIWINEKPYVGSAVSFIRRNKDHIKLLRSNKHYNTYLQNAFNKYGEDAFEFREIEIIENPTKQVLEQREQYWIDFYNSANPDNGYNICPRAYSTIGVPAWNKGIPMPDHIKQILIKVNTGRKHTPEELEKMRLANIGRIRPDYKGPYKWLFKICLVCSKEFKGPPNEIKKRKYCSIKCSNIGRKGQKLGPFSEEHIKNISLALIGRIVKPFTEEHKRKISISNLGKNTGKSRPHSKESIEIMKQIAKSRSRNNLGEFIQGDNYEN